MRDAPRLLAIGDIHGCSIALDTLLELVKPAPQDTLVFLGDYVDRGPDSRGVIERLIKLSKREHTVMLRGNHDVWMLRASREKGRFSRHGWFRTWLDAGVGGIQTLQSYGAETIDDVPTSHWTFLEELRDCYEMDDFIFTHASLDGRLPLEEQTEEFLLWNRVAQATQHYSGKTLICGHTSQKKGLPLYIGYAICIDTAAVRGGWLSCLEPSTLYLWQANQAGETREGWLGDFVNVYDYGTP